MFGGMQDFSLRVTTLIDHAVREHGSREIVTRWADGSLERSNWANVGLEARKMAQALLRLGMKKGDRIATLAMNHGRHLASWYGVAGMGGILHTVNPRLFEEQLVYIFNHAEDRVLFYDAAFQPIIDKLKPQLKTIEHYFCYDGAGDVPDYLGLISAEDGVFDWVDGDEHDPCGLCYTSGTTGDPKGVLYTHRSNVLHAIAEMQPDVFSLSSRTVALPIVPMFHANAWGLPYAGAAAGAKMVFSTVNDPAVLWELIRGERVTHSAGVPTVWLSLFAHMDANGGDYAGLERIVIGGSAAPRAMIERFLRAGVLVGHAWGMTETSPIGTMGALPPGWETLSIEEQVEVVSRQGRVPYLVEMRIVDDDGNVLPRNGEVSGRLQVRGPWIIARYFQDGQGPATDKDNWFDTGDVSILHPDGTMQITDRSKDVIKSGGEWISSIELENAAMGCAGVAEAAAVGIYHPKWDERPLLLVVRKPDSGIGAQEVLDHLNGKIAKWWMPDEVKFVEQLPHTATGKLLKRAIRDDYRDYRFPGTEASGA